MLKALVTKIVYKAWYVFYVTIVLMGTFYLSFALIGAVEGFNIFLDFLDFPIRLLLATICSIAGVGCLIMFQSLDEKNKVVNAMLHKLNLKAIVFVAIITAIISILGTMFFGTTNTITVDGKNGSEITVTLKATAIPAALEDCDFKKLGDKCAVKSEVDAEMTKAPTVTEEVTPAPVVAPVIEPK